MTLPAEIPIGGAQQRIEEVPTASLQLPQRGEPFILDQSVVDGTYVSRWPHSLQLVYAYQENSLLKLAFPVPGTTLIQAVSYAHSISSTVAKLDVQLPDTTIEHYFLKVAYRQYSYCNIVTY
jgi:hypothetical protein